MRYPSTAFWLVSSVLLAAVASISADELVLPTSAKMVHETGGRNLGEFPEAKPENGLLLGEKLAIAMPAARYFNPSRGSIELEVRPAWSGSDGAAHALFHLGDGNAHVTVFKTDTGSMRFVYKASPTQYVACNIDVTAWKAGERHTIGAYWLEVRPQELLLQLRVDEQSTLQSGAMILTKIPKELYLGRRGQIVQPAEAHFLRFRLSDDPGDWPYPTEPKTPVTATVDLADTRPTRRVHDFTTIWNNRENPLPFDVGDPEYKRFLDAKFRMVRLVAFSESWLWGTEVSVSAAGELETDFTDFDRLLDVFSTAGAEPYIRLAYHTPHALVDPSLPIKEQRYALPSDMKLWDELMERIVRHVRFDRDLPVRYWVTALNEADLAVRRGLAKADTTYQLYERTSRLVKKLDPEARVGGPALAWSVEADGKPSRMLVDFVRFCRDRNVPLDFVCFHGYHKAHPRDYERLLQTVRATVEREWPEKKDKLEYILDEWNLWNRDRRQDNEYAASYLAGALHYQRRGGLTRSSIVSFNHFLPIRGQFVYNDDTIARYVGLPLIKGPVVTTPYFVWLMHSRLADHEASVELPGQDGILRDDSGGLTATVSPDRVALLLWHFDLLRDEPRHWTVHLDHLPANLRSAKQVRMTEYRIDHEHNNPYTRYVEREADSQDGKYNLETAHLEPLRSESVSVTDDGVTVEMLQPNQSVSLLEFEMAGP